MSRFQLTIQDSIGVWTWHDTPLNLLSRGALEELDPLIQQLEASRVKALILVSGNPKGFHAGADLKALSSGNFRQISDFISKAQNLYQRIGALPAFKIAAIHGACLGAGLELALFFDRLLAASEKETRLALPETRLGLIPPLGALFHLPRRIRLSQSLQMLIQGKALSSDAALQTGLVDETAPFSELKKRAFAAAQEALKEDGKLKKLSGEKKTLFPSMLARPFILSAAERKVRKKFKNLHPAPPAVLNGVKRNGSAWQKDKDKEEFMRLLKGSESRRLIRLFFQMRKSGLPAVKPAAQDLRSEVKTAAVIGAGVMGGALARLFVEKGFSVRLVDKNPKALSQALKEADSIWRRREANGEISSLEGRDLRLRLMPALDFKGFRSVDLALETVCEDLELKQEVHKTVSRELREDALTATASSSLTVERIMAKAIHPQRALGLHFFHPVDRMPLVEAAPTAQTHSDFLKKGLRFVKQLGKTAVVAPDIPGFIVNRLLARYLSKTLHLLAEGYSPVF